MNDSVEQALIFMGVRHGTGREVAYQHWFDFLRLMQLHDGGEQEYLLSLARSYVGVDERYVKQYLKSAIAWGTLRVEAGKIFYVGKPRGKTIPKGRPFVHYSEPPKK